MTFSVGKALGHFWQIAGARLAMMFVLLYLLSFGLLQLLGTIVNWPIYEIYAEFFGGLASGNEPSIEDFEAFEEQVNRYQLRNALWSLVSLPLTFGLYAVLEAALQRKLVRGEPFRLRLGADEGRLAVIALIWVGIMIGAYIAFIFVAAFSMIVIIPAALLSPIAGIIVGIIVALLILALGIYFVTRLSTASALTIRDEAIRFFESWTVTRGRWGAMFGAYFILSLVAILAVTLLYAGGFAVGYSQVAPFLDGEDTDVGAVAAALLTPQMLGAVGVLGLIYMVVYAFIWAIWSGVAALAAKTDPFWPGNPDIATEFS